MRCENHNKQIEQIVPIFSLLKNELEITTVSMDPIKQMNQTLNILHSFMNTYIHVHTGF
jgi:hypothetical protein